MFSYQQDIEDLTELLGASPSMEKVIRGVGGMVTRNLTLSFSLFHADWFPVKASVCRSLVKLTQGMWGKNDFKRVLRIIRECYYHDDPSAKTFLDSEMQLLVDTVKALEGDMMALARVGDHVLYQNESSICQVLVSLVTSNTGYEPLESDST